MSRLRVLTQKWSWRECCSLALLSFLIVFLVVELRSLALLAAVYDTNQSLTEVFTLSFLLLGGLFTLFPPLGSLIVILFAILSSINLILLYQYIKQQRAITQKIGTRATTASTAGAVAALLGIGCATCGTAILFAVLSSFGASGLILLLPLHGQEFGIIGVAGLLYATWHLLGKLHQPYVC